jgi:hypothetical protein
MIPAARTLRDAVLQLPDEERAWLAAEILSSLDGRRIRESKPPGRTRSTADRIELVPVRLMKEMRGFAKGIDTSSFKRDADRL